MRLAKVLINGRSGGIDSKLLRCFASASSSTRSYSYSSELESKSSGFIANITGRPFLYTYPQPWVVTTGTFVSHSAGVADPYIGNYKHAFRTFSSQAPNAKNDENDKKNEQKDDDVLTSSTNPISTNSLLYKANASRAKFPRMLLAGTTIHTGFWTWYIVDFLPTIAAQGAAMKGIDVADVDLTGGYLGLGLAIFMSIGACVYPRSLVCEISRKDYHDHDNKDNETKASTLLIKTYSLPFITPKSISKEYPLGDFIIDSSNDAIKIIKEHDGDIGKFHGHIALHGEGSYTNFLMKFSGEDDDRQDSQDGEKKGNKMEETGKEVVDKELLIQSLTSSKQLVVDGMQIHSSSNQQQTNLSMKRKKRKNRRS